MVSPRLKKERATPLPHVKAACPLSGMVFGSKRIDYHLAMATACKNGTIHIYCLLHRFRGFISHPHIVEILNAEGRKTQASSVPSV